MSDDQKRILAYIRQLRPIRASETNLYYVADDGTVTICAPPLTINRLWQLEYKMRTFRKVSRNQPLFIDEIEVSVRNMRYYIVATADVVSFDKLNTPPYAGKHHSSATRMFSAVLVGGQIYMNFTDRSPNMYLVVNWPLPDGELQKLYPIFPLPNLPQISKRIRKANGVNAHFI